MARPRRGTNGQGLAKHGRSWPVAKPITEMLNTIEKHKIFMEGRNIMSGIMALHEVLHETKKTKKVGIVLKLDFEKAYDKSMLEVSI